MDRGSCLDSPFFRVLDEILNYTNILYGLGAKFIFNFFLNRKSKKKSCPLSTSDVHEIDTFKQVFIPDFHLK